jgi:hypothetical protein
MGHIVRKTLYLSKNYVSFFASFIYYVFQLTFSLICQTLVLIGQNRFFETFFVPEPLNQATAIDADLT